MHLIDQASVQHAQNALLALLSAILLGKKILKHASKLFPKGTGAFLIEQCRKVQAYVVRETTPPIRYPLIRRMAEVFVSAHFYVQALTCVALFLLLLLKLDMSHITVWRFLAAAAITPLIGLMFSFCFTQAEKLRVKLREESVALW
ncbi:hypothetical protein ISP17_03435 [Dyella ginsengisoli]|uniref:Uncharacterized protein n=1 Tax=Dyella ginsengisoli TaxID=363848 RepID=A0ABW8JPF9_9GAMM